METQTARLRLIGALDQSQLALMSSTGAYGLRDTLGAMADYSSTTFGRGYFSLTTPRTLHDFHLTDNVSAVHLRSDQFSHMLHEILLQTGLSPQRLELEITETALIRNFDRALSTLRQVKSLGVRIAMDDFGTGYSSLANLRAFLFDKIKIDASFIKSVDRNGEAAAIVRAILGLGKGLGLPVLAEGIETAGELEFLASESCGEGQGYYFGHPAPIEAFSDVLYGAKPPAQTFPNKQTKTA